MPGINGMDPSLMPSQTETIKAPKGADPSLYEGVQKGGQTEQPTSIFHSLDNQPQDGKVDYNEAKNSIFSHINSAGREATINVSSGSHSFKSMFTSLAEKFQGVQYETTEAGVKTVDEQISSAARDFNAQVTQMYDQYVQQRNSEATPELSADKTSLEYKDAAGITFRTEKVTVDTTSEGLTMYRDSNGKMIYAEDTENNSTTTTVRDNNGNVLTSTTRDAEGNVTQSSSNTYNESGQQTSRTYTSNGETFTAEYTYHENGQRATETVKDANGNVVEQVKYDEKGNETSLEIKTDEVTINQTTTYNKKGDVKSFTRTDSTNDGQAASTTQENYDKKGNLRQRQTSFATNDENAEYTRYNTNTEYRKNGTVKKENTTATSRDGEQISVTNKFKKDGSNRFTRIGATGADGTNFEEKGKDWRIKAENSSAKPSVEQTKQTEETQETQEPKPFDFKGKTPSGYTQIKGYPDHYYDGNGRVYTFTANEEGKPIAKRELSAHARMYEARFKLAKENAE